MLIPDKFPQFADKKTLIIVASTQAADLHIAHESEIETVAEVRLEKGDQDEQQSHFERRTQGKTLGSGGTEIDETEKTKKDFYRELAAALEKIDTDSIEQTILLSSSQDKATTKDKLPTKLQDSIELEINGNYVGEHPNDILARILEADQ